MHASNTVVAPNARMQKAPFYSTADRIRRDCSAGTCGYFV